MRASHYSMLQSNRNAMSVNKCSSKTKLNKLSKSNNNREMLSSRASIKTQSQRRKDHSLRKKKINDAYVRISRKIDPKTTRVKSP